MTAVPSGPALLRGSRARRLCAAASARAAAWAALALAVVVSGCAADAGPSSGSSSGEPLAALSATVKQYREDEIAGRLQVSLTNQGARTAVVASVRLDSADFAPAEASRPQLHLAPGQRTDVPVAYGSIRCDGTVRRTASRAIVHVDVSRPGAAAVPLALEVPPTPSLDRLVERSCRREQLERVLDVGVDDVRIPRDGDVARARVTLAVAAAADAPLTLTSVDGSVMFDLELTDTATVLPGRAASVPVRIRPGRCDPHAFLESKRTFLFTAYVTPREGEATYLGFALDDERTQHALTAWARARCGL